MQSTQESAWYTVRTPQMLAVVAGKGEEPLEVHLCPDGPVRQSVESTGAYLHQPGLREHSLALLFLLSHHPTSGPRSLVYS